MPALAIIVILLFFGWICSMSWMVGLVLFFFFGMPLVIMYAFAVDTTFGMIVLLVCLGVGVWLAPWLFIPIIGIGIVILGVASAS